MEVHAHAHTTRKKWTHYLWEFLMLFLAVFCGFLAENFREHQLEKKKEKQYIRSLWQDLREDTTMFGNILFRYKESNEMIDTLIRLLKSNQRNQLSCRIYNLARTIPFSDLLPQPFNKTFEQLKSSGNLRLINNSELLDEIGSYYKTYDFMTNGGPGQMQFQNRHDLYLFTYELFDIAYFEKMLRTPNSTHVNNFNNLDSCEGTPALLTNDPIIINKICARYHYMHLTRTALLNWVNGLLMQADTLLKNIQHEYHFQ
jgi:hypothetical protein